MQKSEPSHAFSLSSSYLLLQRTTLITIHARVEPTW